jgi:RimJ/RimL family protein N-acetyltransferase
VRPGSFFETPRLRARPFALEDVETFVGYRQDPDVERYQSWSGYTLQEGRALIASMQDASLGVPGEWYQIALEEQATGALVGDLALRVDATEPREAEIGFTLAPAYQGRGYASEAVRALLGHLFETLGMHRVVAVTDVLNEPAAALLQRVGMRREAELVENVFFKGAWGSEFLFAILDREWAQLVRRTPGG